MSSSKKGIKQRLATGSLCGGGGGGRGGEGRGGEEVDTGFP